MTKYQLTKNGVKDLETGATISGSPDHRHWREYQKWLDAGGIPIPESPSSYHILSGDQWVADPATVLLAKKTEVYTEARAIIDGFGRQYSSYEAADWGRLEDEARVYLAEAATGELAPAVGVVMQAEIDAGSPFTATDLADHVAAKADVLRVAKAGVIAKRRVHVIALDGIYAEIVADVPTKNIDELVAYDVNAGW